VLVGEPPRTWNQSGLPHWRPGCERSSLACLWVGSSLQVLIKRKEKKKREEFARLEPQLETETEQWKAEGYDAEVCTAGHTAPQSLSVFGGGVWARAPEPVQVIGRIFMDFFFMMGRCVLLDVSSPSISADSAPTSSWSFSGRQGPPRASRTLPPPYPHRRTSGREGTLAVHEIELVVVRAGIGDGGGVGGHARHCWTPSGGASGNGGGLVVVDADPVGRSRRTDGCAWCLWWRRRRSRPLGDDVSAVHHAAGHVLSVAGIALGHHGQARRRRLESQRQTATFNGEPSQRR
jgi:hypothetical protein